MTEKITRDRPLLGPNSNKLGKCECVMTRIVIVTLLDMIMMVELCILKLLYFRESHQSVFR